MIPTFGLQIVKEPPINARHPQKGSGSSILISAHIAFDIFLLKGIAFIMGAFPSAEAEIQLYLTRTRIQGKGY